MTFGIICEETQAIARSQPAPRIQNALASRAQARRLAMRLAGARLVLFWEAALGRLWPLLGVVGLFLAVALAEVLPRLPGWAHAGLLGLFLVALLAALIPLFAEPWHWPGEAAARRRLERDSGVPHRPLTAIDDRLATSPGDRAAGGLWELYRQRLLAETARLRVRPPRPVLAKADPLALRTAVLLLLLIGLGAAGSEWLPRFKSAFQPQLALAAAAPPARLDAWVNPPDYTGLPPLFLGGDSAPVEAIRVPVGSTLLAQVQGPDVAPELRLDEQTEAFVPVAPGVYKVSRKLESGSQLAIAQQGKVLGQWPLEILPDLPPGIEFLSPPSRTERSALRLEYQASDDYGLVKVVSLIRLIEQPEAKPIVLDLALPGSNLREAAQNSFHDLTPHPWAGLAVEIELVASDALGQTGQTERFRTVLPERIFNHPVARALIELRRMLTQEPERRFPVMRGLSELYRHPEHFYHDVVVALALVVVERRLLFDRSSEVIPEVQSLMWDTALRIEEGELAIAEQDLRALQEALKKALAEGASEAEIDRLMDQLREAMDRFLEALAEQMMEQMAQGAQPQPMPEGSQLLEGEQLREMLERARELAKSGARDAAQQLLSQLQNMLENLRANPMAQMMNQEGQNAWDMLRDMEEMMQRQQELLDRSYDRSQQDSQQQSDQQRMGEQQRPGDRQRQGEGRQQSQSGKNDNRMDAQTQEAIRQRLGEMMRQLGEMMGDIPRPLGRAEQAMRDARDALNQEQPGEAIAPQSRALDQLQQGMQSMADAFMERMGQSQAQRGSGPIGMEPGMGRDPLGRNTGENGLEALEGVEIPDQMELRRAREILIELRRRRGEPSRPPLELDYIDRLLQQF